MLSYQNKNLLFFISILAAFLGCVADVLLLYSPSGNYHLGDYQFFKEISKDRIIPGYYLGILFIAFELLGFWLVSKAVFPRNESKNRLFFAGVCFMFLLGIIYHAAVTFIGVFIKEVDDGLSIVENYQILFRPLELVMGLCLVVVTGFIVVRILQEKTLFPKWILWFNPALIYLLLIGLYILIPKIGNLLIVAGFNLSNGIFLAASAYALRNETIRDDII